MNIATILRDTLTQLVGGMLTGHLVDLLPLTFPSAVNKSNVLKSGAELLIAGGVGSFLAYNWMDMMKRRGYYSGADTANLLVFYSAALATMPNTTKSMGAFTSGVHDIIANSYFVEGAPPTKMANQDNTAAQTYDTSYNHGSPDNNPATSNAHEEDPMPIVLDSF